MKVFLIILCGLSAFGWPQPAQAATLSAASGTLNVPIVKVSGGMTASILTVTNQPGLLISSVRVSLNITGGENGDLYGLLEHNGKTSVLINRPGRDTSVAGREWGSPSSGLNVTFFDAAPTDLQSTIPMTVTVAPVTGNYQPDGRAVPTLGDLNIDTPRTKMLSQFTNEAADGDWTLTLVRINDSNVVSTLQSWSIEVETTAVPEPGAALSSMLLVCSGLYVRFIRRRRRHQMGSQGAPPPTGGKGKSSSSA